MDDSIIYERLNPLLVCDEGSDVPGAFYSFLVLVNDNRAVVLDRKILPVGLKICSKKSRCDY